MQEATQQERTTQDLESAGFTLLEARVPTGHRYVDVWDRLNADEDGWDYVVSVNEGGRDRILNFENPLTYSPHVVAIGRLMIESKIFDEKPELGFEYAISVNGCNDYEGNFATETLRDRAIDELMLSGVISTSNEDDITRFQIEAAGDQHQERGASLDLWLRDSKCIAGLSGTSLELRIAILIDDQEKAQEAISGGADPHRATSSGMTEFHRAAKLGRAEILAMMDGLDEHVNDKGPEGNTPLHLAVEADHAKVCGMLYANGARVDATNEEGETPFDISKRSHDPSIQRLFASMQARHAAESALKELMPHASP